MIEAPTYPVVPISSLPTRWLQAHEDNAASGADVVHLSSVIGAVPTCLDTKGQPV